MKTYLFLFTISFFYLLKAQAPEIDWATCYGGTKADFSHSITLASDSGYIFAGTSNSNDGDVSGNHTTNNGINTQDGWVAKINLIGEIEWQKSIGGSDLDIFVDVKYTPSDGGSIIGGVTLSNDGDVSNNHGNGDAWIVKLDEMGNMLWQKALGGSRAEDLGSLNLTHDGGYILALSSSSNDGDVISEYDSMDWWIVKLDESGNIVWQKIFGGSVSEYVYSIQQTTDEGYIIAGHTNSNDRDVVGWHEGFGILGYPTNDVWIAKLDENGNLQWQKCLGGSEDDFANSIIQTLDGGYIIAGNTYSNDGDVSNNQGGNDAWIIKLDSLGNLQWEKTYGGSQGELLDSVIQLHDGTFIFTGATGSNDGDVSYNHSDYFDIWFLKLDETGNLQWEKCFGGTYDEPVGTAGQYTSIELTLDDSFIFTTGVSSFDGDITGYHGSIGDVWVAKLESNLATEEINHTNISIFPNPVNEIVNFSERLYDIEIYSIDGKKIISANNEEQINVSQLPKGSYVLNAKTINGKKVSSKFIKN